MYIFAELAFQQEVWGQPLPAGDMDLPGTRLVGAGLLVADPDQPAFFTAALFFAFRLISFIDLLSFKLTL